MRDSADFSTIGDFDPFSVLDQQLVHEAYVAYIVDPVAEMTGGGVVEFTGEVVARRNGVAPMNSTTTDATRHVPRLLLIAACLAAAVALAIAFWPQVDFGETVVTDESYPSIPNVTATPEIEAPVPSIAPPAVAGIAADPLPFRLMTPTPPATPWPTSTPVVVSVEPLTEDPRLVRVSTGAFDSYGTLTEDGEFVGVSVVGNPQQSDGTVYGVTARLEEGPGSMTMVDFERRVRGVTGTAGSEIGFPTGGFVVLGSSDTNLTQIAPCVYRSTSEDWDGLGICSNGQYVGAFIYDEGKESPLSTRQGWHYGSENGAGFDMAVIDLAPDDLFETNLVWNQPRISLAAATPTVPPGSQGSIGVNVRAPTVEVVTPTPPLRPAPTTTPAPIQVEWMADVPNLVRLDHGSFVSYGTLTDDGSYAGITTYGDPAGGDGSVVAITGRVRDDAGLWTLIDLAGEISAFPYEAGAPTGFAEGLFASFADGGKAVELTEVEPCVYLADHPDWIGIGICSGGYHYLGTFVYRDQRESPNSTVQGWHYANAREGGFDVTTFVIASDSLIKTDNRWDPIN